MRTSNLIRVLLLLLTLSCFAGLAYAQDATTAPEVVVTETAETVVAEPPALDAGNTAWMMTSTVLVLMMAIPGLALFYAGMVRKKNVLSVLMQVFATVCVISLVWAVIGYSLAFTDGNQWVGDLSRAMLSGVTVDSRALDLQTISAGAPWFSAIIPETVFMMFQMTFAAITPAIIVGAFVDRMKFAPMLVFMVLWSILVYAPIAHWVWSPNGFLFGDGVLDFAGGTVVHINAGIAGLVCCLVLGKRIGFGQEHMAPAQSDAHPDRHLAPVGGLVRLQRRFAGRRRWSCGHGHGRHPHRGCVCGRRLDAGRVDRQGQAVAPGHRLGCRWRSGRDHARLRLSSCRAGR